jgi:hypothetical protein
MPKHRNFKKKKKNVSGQKSQIGLDTKTYWLTVSSNVTLSDHHPRVEAG